MRQIVSSIRQVETILVEISLGGQRQAAGIEQIGQAIGSMGVATFLASDAAKNGTRQVIAVDGRNSAVR